MKQINIIIHPFSALAGMALLGLVLVTAGAMPLQGSSSTRDVSAIEVVSDPHPRDNVVISGGMPFVVPSGRLLVVTALGDGVGINSSQVLFVDGISEVSAVEYTAGGSGGGRHWASSVLQLPTPGLTAQSGQTVTLSGSSSRAWGYLVDA